MGKGFIFKPFCEFLGGWLRFEARNIETIGLWKNLWDQSDSVINDIKDGVRSPIGVGYGSLKLGSNKLT